MAIIAIICATHSEYLNIKRYANVKHKLFIHNYDVVLCDEENINYIIICSRSGINNAKECIEILMREYNLSLILSVGIAGGLVDYLNIGDIVISDNVYLVDKDKEVFTIDKSLCMNLYKIINNIIVNSQHMRGLLPRVYTGSIISVNKVVANSQAARFLNESFNGICVEMESGIIAKLCQLAGIRVVAVKIISDFANEEAFSTMNKNYFKATSILGKVLCESIKHLS